MSVLLGRMLLCNTCRKKGKHDVEDDEPDGEGGGNDDGDDDRAFRRRSALHAGTRREV